MNTNPSTLVGVFATRAAAERAIEDLQNAGFDSSQIGIVSRHDVADTTPHLSDEGTETATGAMTGALAGAGLGALAGLGILAGVIPVVGPAIAGGTLGIILSNAAAGAGLAGLTGALVGAGMSEEDASYYQSEFEAGRTIVTVNPGARVEDARLILQRHGMIEPQTSSYRAESDVGFEDEMTGLTPTPTGSQRFAETGTSVEDETLHLHEEQLRARTHPVETGEVRVRKEVVTEQRSMEVPVEREEIVIERHAPTGDTAEHDTLRPGEELRIPVTEEEVVVDKENVVREEVSVGKRKIQDTERVSGTVRKEELRIDREGDVDVRGMDPDDRRRL